MPLQIKINCPFCKAKIPSDALRCFRCGADLNTQEIKEKIEKQISKKRKNALIITIIFVIFLVWFFSSLSKNPPSPPTSSIPSSSTPISQSREEESPAFMLAIIESNNTNPPTTLVKQFDDLLDNLQTKCKEKDRELLSDYIVKSKELIEKDGGKTTLLNFAKALNESIPEELAPMSCKDMAAILIAMMVANK